MSGEEGAAFIPRTPPRSAQEALVALESRHFFNRAEELAAHQNMEVRVRNEVAEHTRFISDQAYSWAQERIVPDIEESSDLRSIYRTVEGLNVDATDSQLKDALRAIDAAGELADRLDAHAENVDKKLAKMDDPLGTLHNLQTKWPTLRKHY